MKTLRYFKSIFFTLLFLCTVVSCTDSFDLHKEYTKNGEIIYTNKPDSLSVSPGRNRAQINGFISNAFNVTEIEVSWNKEEGKQIFPYNKSDNKTDTLKLIVENLEEKSYAFTVSSTDASGNKSIQVNTFGTVYGETYRTNLTTRLLNSIEYGIEETVLSLKTSARLARDTEVKYTNANQEERILTVHRDSSSVILDNLNNEFPISYRTFYVPTAADEEGNETSIDKFESDWAEITVPDYLREIFSDSNLTLTPSAGGIEVTWNNPGNQELTLKFKFTYSGNSSTSTTSSSETDGNYFIANIDSGLQIINVAVSDVFGTSLSKDYEIDVPGPLMPLDKSNWSIIDFSSEEAVGEGANNGHAIHLIDGELATFWHSRWRGGAAQYPHHVTIDLGVDTEQSIQIFEIFRRRGNNGGGTKFELWVTNDYTGADTTIWTKVGTHTGRLDSNDGVKVVVDANTTAKYVQIRLTEGTSASGILAELDLY